MKFLNYSHFMNAMICKDLHLYVLIILCCLTSCKKENASRTHFPNAVFVTTTMSELPTVYVDGKLFTGELWSNDDRTMCMEVKDGQVETFTLYHMNGKVANIQYGNGDGNNFDEFGNTLSETELDHKYPYLRQATERILKQEIMPNVKQH